MAIAEALAVVKVGNSEWLLRRLTPSRASVAIVGAVVSSTIRDRSPSATNSTTLWGRGDCAEAMEMAARIKRAASDKQRYIRITPGTS